MTRGNNSSSSPAPGSADYLKWVDLAPVIIDFINANPDNVFAKILAALAGVLFKDGKAEFPPVEPEIQAELSQKAQHKLDSDSAAKAYLDSIGNPDKDPAEEIKVRYEGSNEEVTLSLKKFVSDPDTGFKGAIYQDASGHSVVFYGGMDMLRGIDMKDAEAIAQARLMKHGVNQQTAPAQDLYIQAAQMSGSTEIVGYSLGAMLANDMAARLDAKATTIADIGLPNLKNTDGSSMYTAENIQNIRENVTVLRMTNDSYFGKAGTVHGKITDLPSVSGAEIINALGETTLPVNFNAQSTLTAHHPVAYVLGSEKLHDKETVIAQNTGPAPQQLPGLGQTSS